VRRHTVGLLVVLFALGAAASANAQTEGRFAVGAEFTIQAAGDRDVRGGLTPGLLWRFGDQDPGWGVQFGLGWFSTELDRSIAGDRTAFGILNIRPFMGGYGYTYKAGRVSVTAAALAGYAFGSVEMTPGATDAYRDRMGARALSVESSNTFTAKPQVDVWYDVSRKVGFNVNAGYVIARPHITMRSSLGEDRRDIRADQFILQAGLVYSIF
jgi:outer membrane protein with beta-barrel domain